MISEINVKRYCKDYKNIENYDLALNDKTQMWDCHHRLETHFSDGTLRPSNAHLTHKELISLGMYFDRTSSELIFLTKTEHFKLHRVNRYNIEYETYDKDYRKKYYEENKEYFKDYGKDYRKENKEYFKDYGKDYRKENKDYFKDYDKKYYEKNKGKRNAYQKVYGWAKRNNFPDPQKARFPKSWTDENIDEYINICYNKYNKRRKML